MRPGELLFLPAFPLTGALIGWVTNFIALKMLFHPRQPLSLPGITIQGLLPRRRRDLAEKIAATVSQEILSAAEISELLGHLSWRREVEGIVASLVREDLLPRPLRKVPGVDLMLSGIQDALTDRILETLEAHRGTIVGRFHEELDIGGMVAAKIESLDLAELEDMIFRLVSRELRHIELVGGAVGFVVGAVQGVLWLLAGG